MDGSFLRLVWNAGQRLSRSATVALVLAGLVPAVAPGQQEEGPPRPFIVSEGPVGAVQALAFSPDSRLLYAAGHDKVVHLWNLTPDERGQHRAAYVRELRWEISRGTRGTLYAVAISPDGTLLAGGGMSARDAGGNLVLWDAGRGEVAQSLPRVMPTSEQVATAAGHVRGQTIQSLDFSPDGLRLASVDTLGEAWLWSQVGNDWAGARIVGGGRPADGRLQLSWIDRDHVAIPDSSPRDDARAHIWRVDGPPVKVEQTIEHKRGVRSLASHPASGRWATADGQGRVFVWDRTRLETPVIQLGELDQVEYGAACDLSFLDRDRLVVLRERHLADNMAPVDTKVQLWDIPTKRLIDEHILSSEFDAYACATSPDGRWIAVHSPDQDSVVLFRINPEGLPEQRPLSGNPTLVLSSRGVHPSAVAFEKTPKGQSRRLGLTRTLTRDPKARFEPNARFDLETLELSPVPQPRPAYVSPDEFRGDWAVKSFAYNFAGGARKSEVQLVHPIQGLVRIELDPVMQKQAISYCFIPDAAGQPYAIAIGTDYEFGIYVYRLPGVGVPRSELIRYFRDHTGGVTSLGVSPDGQLLASAATDQTVKVWSLKHLIRGQNPFVRAPAWGADFQLRRGQVIVTAVHPEGIAAARRLQVGDVVTELVWTETRGTETPKTLASQRPDEIFSVLSGAIGGKRVELWESHLLQVRRGGQGEPVTLPIVVPAWEPLATLFVDRHEEWVLFTPAGYFQASPAEGADLLGWQVNRGAGFTPRVANAQELRRDLEQPAKVKASFVSFEPPAVVRPVATALKSAPELHIESPQLNETLPHGQPIDMAASVKLPGTQSLEGYEFEVFVNSLLKKPAAELVAPGHVRLTWTAPGSRTLNDIHIRAFQREGGKLRLVGESRKFKIASDKRGAAPLPPMRINLVTIACQEYTGKQVPKLNFTVSDARRLKGALTEASQHSLARFKLSRTYHLENGEVSAAAVQSLLTGVARDLQQDRATEDDLLIIGLTGHGMEVDNDFYFLPLSIQDATTDDGLKANARKVGITWEHILRPIASLGCRKLLIVDACQSGGLAQTQGPVYRDARNQSVLVMTASSANESALEDASFGGGIFTDSLVTGLKTTDEGDFLEADGYRLEVQEDEAIRAFKSSFGTVSKRAQEYRDSMLTLSELAVFASMRVKNRTAEQQNPCFATTRRLREDEVYLTESNDGSGTGTSATTAPADR